jgi:HAD superfamily hydrolase (TIGR01450 family)
VRLDDVRGFVFDVDGTLVHRAGTTTHVAPGAVEVLERILGSGRSFVLFTNGSHVSPEGFAAGLRESGLPVADEQMLTPLRSALYYLEQHHPGATVRLFGTPSAKDYMTTHGVRLVEGVEAESAEVVFVAHVDELSLEELEHAARAIMAGGELLTGSYVPAYAGANGPIISRGAMTAAALAKASSVQPKIVGKPSEAAVAVVSERLGLPGSQIAVIGDDLSMDIGLGHMAGSRTVFVRSGIDGELDVSRLPEQQRPHAVVDGVADVLELL